MINKRISKITMLTALFVAGIVNAQEFYTCVPKKSWWKDVMTESVAKGILEDRKIKLKCLKEKSKCEEKNKKIRECLEQCLDICLILEKEGGVYDICSRECETNCGFISDCEICP